MTRRQKPTARKKHAGVLMGMRSGVQKVAGTVGGGSAAGGRDRDEKVAGDGMGKSPSSKTWSLVGNIISGLLIVAAIAIFLRRCGIVHF
jgi:hypothetical protein